MSKLIVRKVGSQYVIASPDLPGLFVAHENSEVARADVGNVVAAMERVRKRIAEE